MDTTKMKSMAMLGLMTVSAILIGAAIGPEFARGHTIGGSCWDFSEGSGSTLNDDWHSTDDSYDATISDSNSPSWVTRDAYNNVIDFDGGSQYRTLSSCDRILAPHHDEYVGDNGFRINAEIYIHSDTETYHAIIDTLKRENSYSYGYTIYLSDDKLRFSVYGGSNGVSDLFSDGYLPADNWIDVKAVYSDNYNYMKLYWKKCVDSTWYTAEKSQYWGPGDPSGDSNFAIGVRSSGWGGTMPWNGLIDNVDITSGY